MDIVNLQVPIVSFFVRMFSPLPPRQWEASIVRYHVTPKTSHKVLVDQGYTFLCSHLE